MQKHFQRDLEVIHQKLMSVFGIVEKMIDKSVSALCENNTEFVATVINSDEKVNETEVEIEEECLKILALHQPVAGDLRRICMVMRINADLERIADLACNIAERAQCLHRHPYFPIPDGLSDMVVVATHMVRQSLDAFVRSDTRLAKEVIQMDARVDDLNRDVIGDLRELMAHDSTLVEPALHCFSASRHIERIADLAENICEDVIYLVDGEIVRHNHNDYFTKPDTNPNALADEI